MASIEPALSLDIWFWRWRTAQKTAPCAFPLLQRYVLGVLQNGKPIQETKWLIWE